MSETSVPEPDSPLFNAPDPATIDAHTQRTPKRTAMLFAAALVLAMIAGLVGYLLYDARTTDIGESPTIRDHWHNALGIYDCNGYQPDIESDLEGDGLHTHNDGLIHIHPYSLKATGKNATLGNFADGLELTEQFDELSQRTTCDVGGEAVPAEFQVLRWATPSAEPVATTDYRSFRFLADGEIVALVLAPIGTIVPTPPSVGELLNLTDYPEGSECSGEKAEGDNSPNESCDAGL